ncbi:MAG: hypothetical protein ABIO37_01815, partial [Caulobacteraceae bacterium]
MNPEFERNLWLEASPRRIGWAAMVLVLVFGAVAVAAPEVAKLRALSICGGVVFFAAAFIWGPRNAGQSVLVEIGQRTWDFQRLSSLTPLAMTWGKLFGATVLAWGVGLVGLLILLLLDPSPAVGSMALRALGIGVLLQSLMLAAALVGVRKARVEGRQPSLRSVMGGGVFVLIVIWSLVGSRLARTGARVGGLGELLSLGKGNITWWGWTFEANTFATCAALIFAG